MSQQHDSSLPPPEEVRLLTPGEVAALFRVDPKTPGRWARAGKLSVYKTPGGHSRFFADEVFGMIADTTVRQVQP